MKAISDSNDFVHNSMSLIKSLYYDPFKWNLIKSIGLTIIGIKFARDCRGLEVMPAIS